MDGLGLDAGSLEVLGQPIDAELRTGEDDGAAGAAGQVGGHLQLVAEREAEGQVLGRRGLATGADDLVPGRVLEVAPDQGVDLAVQRGREEQPLGVAVGLVEQLLHDREEAQVGHEVGLVQHGDDDLGEAGLTLADQVLQPAGGRDDHVDAAAELLDLAVHGRAAVDGGELDADGLTQRGQRVVHLLRQLAGRNEHEATRGTAALLGVGTDAGKQRQAEGQRLARPGGGLAEHVAPGERVRQGGGLDGERAVDAAPLQRRHQLLGQAQLAEGGTGRRLGDGVDGGVLNGVLGGVRLEGDRVDHGHAGWGSDTARSAARERRRGSAVAASSLAIVRAR